MPRSELGPHQALLEVPAGLDARREVFCCRYTGEVFLEYEEYVKRQNLYRQRAWSSKYSGEGGMTYEEAVASEHKVASVVEQFPAVYEERALRLVHHSTEPLEQLATRVLAHFTSNFVVGEELTGVLPDGRLAPCVVRSVHSTSAPAPQPLPNGILAGCEPNGPTEGPDGPSVGGAAAGAAEGNAGFGGGEQPLQQQQGQQGQPQASSHEEASYEVEWTGVESSPAAGQHSTVQRGALNRRHPSPITALTPALLSKWLETVAWAEPVTGVPGVDCVWHVCDFYRDKYSLPEQLPADMAERLRPSRQKALLKVPSLKDGAAGRRGGEVEFVESTFSEDDEQGAGGLGPGAGDGKPFVDRGEKGDHDFQVEEELQVAREEYASDEEFESDDDYRPIHPGLEGRMKPPPARTPRGRGRGRWGRGRGRWGAGPRLAHSPPEPPPPASQQPPPPPSLQASDVQAMVEGLEEVERRLQPGSIKHSVFMILKEAGEAGVTISDLVTAAEEKGLKTWDDPRQAKNSVASTCAHDPAFVRVGPAKFALRALVSSQQLLAEDSFPLDQLDEGAQKQLAAVGQQQKEAMRKLAEEKHKPKVEKNNFKCPKCHRTTHHEQSPLLLCDTCPRSYHMACLGLDWRDLPSDDWCCPKCVESTQAALRRVMDLETRKREALERATSRQSEAEDKLLRRLLQKEERERRKAEGLPLGTAGSRALRPAQRGPPDDWETLQDEKENLGRLEIRARELAELAARNPLPEGGIDFADDETASVHQRAAETREALHRLQQILSGPPTFEPLVGSAACAASLAAAADGGGSTGAGLKVEAAGGDGDRGDSSEVQQAVLNEALSLAEFLRIFGEACVAPILTVQDLYRAAAWPLDSPSLPALYSAMLQCCLLEQLNHDPPAKNRARRWSRMLTLSDSVWPELLRRYLAVTRSKTAKDTSYDLTVDPVLMSDDQVALFAAEHLSEAPWWTLPASAHLRLLNVLCYDVAQGYRLRQEINARQQDIVKIQTERFREQTQGRRGGSVVVGGKRGADNGELAPTAGSSKKRKGKKAAAAIALPEPTEEELEEMEAELEAAALEEGEGELDEAARTRRQREAEYDARMQLRASRTEPLGLDRYHRRYWWLRSDPGFVFVEGADGGGGMAAIRTKEELDEVISKLNRRGPREGGLHRGLRRRYNAITTAMANQLSQDAVAGCYVLAQVPRPAAPPPAAAGAPAGVAQHSVEELAQAQDAEVLSEAREKLELFITETQDIGVQMSCELKEVRRQLRAAQTPQQLCEFLLVLESFLGTAGEGLPPGADNVSIALLLGDVPALPEAPSSTALEMQDTAQGGQPGPTAGPAPAAGPAGQTPIKQEPQDGGAAPGREIGAVAGGPAAVEAGAAGSEQRGAAGQDQEQQEGAVKMEVDEGLGAHGSAADLTAAAAGGASVSLAAAAAELKQEDVAAGAAVDVAMVDAPQVDQQPAGEAAAPQASAPHAATAAAAGPALLGKPPLPPSAFAAAGDASGAVPAADDDGAQQVQQALAQHAQQRPLIKSDSLAESLGGTTTATGDEQTQGTGADAGQEQFRPVQPDDDLEDSDAEHAYLREKRMRRPARLWRSARERAVWIKLTREAGNIATKACYAALLLRDRAGPMLQRFISIADEQARWEAEERERQRLEKAESRKRLSETGEEGPPERPLMIRTGKAKTEEGVKIVLKAMGNQPFAMGRHASSIDIIAAPEQVAACRWGYQCSVCLLAGDLLCCEHPDGCNVSCHTECTGLAGLPKGPYICMNHDSRELKTRIRRRASSSLPAKEEAPGGEGAGDDDEATVSEDTQTVDSEATEDEAPRSRSARKRPRRG